MMNYFLYVIFCVLNLLDVAIFQDNLDWKQKPTSPPAFKISQIFDFFQYYQPEEILHCNETACMNLCYVMDYRPGGYCIKYSCQCIGKPVPNTVDWSSESVKLNKKIKITQRQKMENAG